MRGRRRTVLVGTSVAVAVVAIGATGMAVASVPDPTAAINACYSTRNGTLKIVDPSTGQACGTNERPLTWNVQGVPGLVGPTGPAGPAGTPGAAGAPGRDGAVIALAGPCNDLPAGVPPSTDPTDPAGGPGGAGGANGIFLKLAGTPGESTIDGYVGDIEVNSFSWGTSNTGCHAGVGGGTASSGAGGASGNVTFGSFRVHKLLDKSSPLLQKDLLTGVPITSGHLAFVKHGTEYLGVDFTMLFVVSESLGTGSGSGGVPEEDLTFNFEKSTQTYTPTATNGTVTGPPITVCWDTKNNVAC